MIILPFEEDNIDAAQFFREIGSVPFELLAESINIELIIGHDMDLVVVFVIP